MSESDDDLDVFSESFERALNAPQQSDADNEQAPAQEQRAGQAEAQPTSKTVGLLMGSDSDWPIMQEAAKILKEFGVPYEALVISAHRTPDLAMEYARTAQGRGIVAIIAGAGGAAHLAGILAAKTTLPVLGVPIPTPALNGLDSLYSTVQMPKGVPVATFAIGAGGAANAALFAIAMLALNDQHLAELLKDFRQKQAQNVASKKLPAL